MAQKKKAADLHSAHLPLRMTKREKAQLRSVARQCGMNMSQWIRWKVAQASDGVCE
jgi:hypothetical protein